MTDHSEGMSYLHNLPRRLVTMIGSVNLDQGANHVQGGRLVLDLDTHRAVVDGARDELHRLTLQEISRIRAATPDAVRMTGSLRIEDSAAGLADCALQMSALRARLEAFLGQR